MNAVTRRRQESLRRRGDGRASRASEPDETAVQRGWP